MIWMPLKILQIIHNNNTKITIWTRNCWDLYILRFITTFIVRDFIYCGTEDDDIANFDMSETTRLLRSSWLDLFVWSSIDGTTALSPGESDDNCIEENLEVIRSSSG